MDIIRHPIKHSYQKKEKKKKNSCIIWLSIKIIESIHITHAYVINYGFGTHKKVSVLQLYHDIQLASCIHDFWAQYASSS